MVPFSAPSPLHSPSEAELHGRKRHRSPPTCTKNSLQPLQRPLAHPFSPNDIRDCADTSDELADSNPDFFVPHPTPIPSIHLLQPFTRDSIRQSPKSPFRPGGQGSLFLFDVSIMSQSPPGSPHLVHTHNCPTFTDTSGFPNTSSAHDPWHNWSTETLPTLESSYLAHAIGMGSALATGSSKSQGLSIDVLSANRNNHVRVHDLPTSPLSSDGTLASALGTGGSEIDPFSPMKPTFPSTTFDQTSSMSLIFPDPPQLLTDGRSLLNPCHDYVDLPSGPAGSRVFDSLNPGSLVHYLEYDPVQSAMDPGHFVDPTKSQQNQMTTQFEVQDEDAEAAQMLVELRAIWEDKSFLDCSSKCQHPLDLASHDWVSNWDNTSLSADVCRGDTAVATEHHLQTPSFQFVEEPASRIPRNLGGFILPPPHQCPSRISPVTHTQIHRILESMLLASAEQDRCHVRGCWHMYARAYYSAYREWPPDLSEPSSNWYERYGHCKVVMYTPRVVQKSYGSEKRFLCPPPLLSMSGAPIFTESPLSVPAGCESRGAHPAVCMTMRREHSVPCQQERGECIMLSECGWRRRGGTADSDDENAFVLMHRRRRRASVSDLNRNPVPARRHSTTSNQSVKLTLDKYCTESKCAEVPADRWVFRNVWVSDQEGLKEIRCVLNVSPSTAFMNSGAGPSCMHDATPEFISSPIKVISKPTKKKIELKGSNPHISSGLIYSGTHVALFNRIRSQTISTKYLTIGASVNAPADGWSGTFIQTAESSKSMVYPGTADLNQSRFLANAAAIKYVFPGCIRPEHVKYLCSSASWNHFKMDVVDEYERKSRFLDLPEYDCFCKTCAPTRAWYRAADQDKDAHVGPLGNLARGKYICFNQTVVLVDPMTGLRSREFILRRVEGTASIVVAEGYAPTTSKLSSQAHLVPLRPNRFHPWVIHCLQETIPRVSFDPKAASAAAHAISILRDNPGERKPGIYLPTLHGSQKPTVNVTLEDPRVDPVAQLHKVALQVKECKEYAGAYLAVIDGEVGVYMPRRMDVRNCTLDPIKHRDLIQTRPWHVPGMIQIDGIESAVWTVCNVDCQEYSFYVPHPQILGDQSTRREPQDNTLPVVKCRSVPGHGPSIRCLTPFPVIESFEVSVHAYEGSTVTVHGHHFRHFALCVYLGDIACAVDWSSNRRGVVTVPSEAEILAQLFSSFSGRIDVTLPSKYSAFVVTPARLKAMVVQERVEMLATCDPNLIVLAQCPGGIANARIPASVLSSKIIGLSLGVSNPSGPQSWSMKRTLSPHTLPLNSPIARSLSSICTYCTPHGSVPWSDPIPSHNLFNGSLRQSSASTLCHHTGESLPKPREQTYSEPTTLGAVTVETIQCPSLLLPFYLVRNDGVVYQTGLSFLVRLDESLLGKGNVAVLE